MKTRQIIKSALRCMLVLTVAGCATSSGKGPFLAEDALVFIQDGKRVAVESKNGVSVVSLANGPFLLVLPSEAHSLRLCASHRVDVFEQLKHGSIPCFAPGTGMAVGREERSTGWLIRLGAEKNGHNYFDESRMDATDGRKTVRAKGFEIISPEAQGAQTIYMIAFVDLNGDHRADAGEIGRFKVDLSEPLGDKRHDFAAMNEFSSALGVIQSNYPEPVSLDTLIDSAIDGFFLEAGLDRPAGDKVARPAPPGPITVDQLNRLTAAFKRVRELRPAIPERRLWTAAMRQMAKDLDKFSAYFDADELKKLQSNETRRGVGRLGHRRGRKIPCRRLCSSLLTRSGNRPHAGRRAGCDRRAGARRGGRPGGCIHAAWLFGLCGPGNHQAARDA